MRKAAISIAALLCVVALVSCAHSMGKKFDESLIPNIKEGVTTKAEILAMFGEPSGTGGSGSGTTWKYMNIQARMRQAFQKVLTITFDSNDVVASYSYESLNL